MKKVYKENIMGKGTEAIGEGIATTLICIFGNPVTAAILIMGLIIGFSSCSSTKIMVAKEKTKQLELKLKIEQSKKARTGVTANTANPESN